MHHPPFCLLVFHHSLRHILYAEGTINRQPHSKKIIGKTCIYIKIAGLAPCFICLCIFFGKLRCENDAHGHCLSMCHIISTAPSKSLYRMSKCMSQIEFPAFATFKLVAGDHSGLHLGCFIYKFKEFSGIFTYTFLPCILLVISFRHPAAILHIHV